MDDPAPAEVKRSHWRGPGAVILAIVTLVSIAVAVIMLTQRQPDLKGKEDRPEGVEITVTAPKPGTPFTIDGAPAGRTPQAIKLRGRKQSLKIQGNGLTIEVNPDRSQVISLDPKLHR